MLRGVCMLPRWMHVFSPLSSFLCMGPSHRAKVAKKNRKSRNNCHKFTNEEGVGIRRGSQVRRLHARQASLYLDHRQDEVDDRAGVQQVVPHVVPEQLG